MKKLFFIVSLFFILPLAKAQTPLQGQSRVVSDSIYSQILGAYCSYTVYLPKSFDVDSSRKYPVLYLLHGMVETHEAWYKYRHFQDVMDLLVSSDEVCEMVVVTPNAGGSYEDNIWNGYFNMPGWAYEDFFFKEFLPYVEATYRVVGDKKHRGITGLSMGGGGATSYAQRHWDMFSAAYAMSALMDVPKGSEQPSPDPEAKINIMTKSAMDNSCIKYVEEADEARLEQLRTVKWFVDCGDDDFLLERNIEFFYAMREKKIPCEFRVRNGGHVQEYWHSALYMCLPFMTRTFEE